MRIRPNKPIHDVGVDLDSQTRSTTGSHTWSSNCLRPRFWFGAVPFSQADRIWQQTGACAKTGTETTPPTGSRSDWTEPGRCEYALNDLRRASVRGSNHELSSAVNHDVSTWNCDVQRGAWTENHDVGPSGPVPERETQKHDCCHANRQHAKGRFHGNPEWLKGQFASRLFSGSDGVWAPPAGHRRSAHTADVFCPRKRVPMATSLIRHRIQEVKVSAGQCYWYRNMID